MRINPVLRNELKLGVRTLRLPVVMMIYNAVLAFICLVVFYSILEEAKWNGRMNFDSVLALYVVMIAIEGVLLAFIVPAITANTISGERERQTLDMLLTTRMTPRHIVTGKLTASLSMITLLIVSSVPIVSIIFIFGGIAIGDVLITMVYLIFIGMLFGALGIACSSRFKRTTSATVISYGSVIGLCAGTLLLVVIVGVIAAIQSRTAFTDIVSIVGIILLLNPAVTVIGIVMNQVAYSGMFESLMQKAFGMNAFISDHWLVLSLIVQLLLLCFLIWRATANLKPKK